MFIDKINRKNYPKRKFVFNIIHMIDHVSINVKDYAASKKFYTNALQPIGYTMVMEFENVAGFGEKGKPDFWIAQKDGLPSHIALQTDSHQKVDEFYKAALAAGGKDNGAPGIRADYHSHYYAAFIIDPDGNNLEVVCHNS